MDNKKKTTIIAAVIAAIIIIAAVVSAVLIHNNSKKDNVQTDGQVIEVVTDAEGNIILNAGEEETVPVQADVALSDQTQETGTSDQNSEPTQNGPSNSNSNSNSNNDSNNDSDNDEQNEGPHKEEETTTAPSGLNPPTDPLNLVVKYDDDKKFVIVEWDDINADGYEFSFRQKGKDKWSNPINLKSTYYKIAVKDLNSIKNGGEFQFWVRAFNSNATQNAYGPSTSAFFKVEKEENSIIKPIKPNKPDKPAENHEYNASLSVLIPKFATKIDITTMDDKKVASRDCTTENSTEIFDLGKIKDSKSYKVTLTYVEYEVEKTCTDIVSFEYDENNLDQIKEVDMKSRFGVDRLPEIIG